jgi:hypothetical protein
MCTGFVIYNDLYFERGFCIVATTVVSNIVQSSTPQLSTMKSSSSASTKKEDLKSNLLNASSSVALDNKPASVDTVKISFQALQSSSDVKKDEAKAGVKKDDTKKVEAKKEAFWNTNNNVSSEGATAKVQFVYNQKGDLITKYLDSGGELIYQVPSKLMLLSQEADSKSKSNSTSNSSIDTRA